MRFSGKLHGRWQLQPRSARLAGPAPDRDSRELADRGHYPAIDILGSISRLMSQVARPEQQHLRESLVRVLAAYRRAEDLININAYVKGSNPEIDYALEKIEAVNRYLRQDKDEGIPLDRAVRDLETIFIS